MITKEDFLKTIKENKEDWDLLKNKIYHDIKMEQFLKYNINQNFEDFIYYYCIEKNFKLNKCFLFSFLYNKNNFNIINEEFDNNLFFELFKNNTNINDFIDSLLNYNRNFTDGDMIRLEYDFNMDGKEYFIDFLDKIILKNKLESNLSNKIKEKRIKI